MDHVDSLIFVIGLFTTVLVAGAVYAVSRIEVPGELELPLARREAGAVETHDPTRGPRGR